MPYASRVRCAVMLVSALALLGVQPAAAQTGATVAGKLFHSVTLKPVEGAIVRLEGTTIETKSGAEGSYQLTNVPPGSYHVLVTAAGYMPQRRDIEVGTNLVVALDVELNPELHFSQVVSVSPNVRDQFESYQPTTVLAGEDLYKQLQATLGATLSAQPGVAERSFGPGPSRPVIRGLDGDRVLILEDGNRMGDLSSQSGDHGVNLSPASASRVEVVRGPATLLYGSNAIGGLVNAITNEIPRSPVTGATGSMTFDLGSVADEAGGAGEVTWGNGNFALHAGGTGPPIRRRRYA